MSEHNAIERLRDALEKNDPFASDCPCLYHTSRDANQVAQRTTETQDPVAALDKIERLLRRAERDSRLLDGRDFKMRPYSEAYRLLDLLRERANRDD